MTPQLTKIAECLSESHAREIKLARCLAESLKRIQTLESAAKTKDTKAKATELRFNAAMRDLAEQLAKQNAENEELIRKMEEAIKVDFPAQLAALKAEFATPAAQAAAPQSFNPRGAYEPSEKYKPFDYVSSNGSSYIALVENPTQPPSKKSKQWMLVAARGAGGGGDSGGVTGLGTAAYRDVGQQAGNVLELSAANTINIGDGSAPSGTIVMSGPDGDVFVGNDNGQLTFNDSEAGSITLSQIALTAEVKSANFTAALDASYTITASCTVTDPTPAQGKGYTCVIRNGTLTTARGSYSIVGSVVRAIFHSGSWADIVSTPFSGTLAISSVTGLGTGVATALAVNAGAAGAFVRTTDTATTTTAGVVPGIGTADTATTNALTVADYLLVPPAIMAWERITAAVTGSGTTEGNSGIYYGVGTGVTASSTSRVDSNTSSGDPWYFGNYNAAAFGATDRYIINGVFLRISSTSTGVWRFGIGKTHGGAVGQWTEAGFGFVCKNLRLWSFTHNGSTYTENDTGVDIPSGEIPMQFCILRNSTAHLFYLNRVLVATHTATGYANGRFIRIEAENGANSAAQRMRISPVTLRFL